MARRAPWSHAAATAYIAASLYPPALAQSVDDIVARAATIAIEERTKVGTLVADETYVQTLESSKSLGGSQFGVGGAGMPAMEQHTTRTKRTVLSTWIATTRPDGPPSWSVIREPREIDGTPASGAARLESLAGTPDQLARAWEGLSTAAEAQHLGQMARDVANPWQAVDLLVDGTRLPLSFKAEGNERLQGAPTTRITVTDRPGLALPGREGTWTRVRGMLWIDADGRTRRSRLELSDATGLRRSRIEADFAFDASLGAVVPHALRERHEFPDGKVDAHATYRNHRRPSGRP